MQCLVLSSQFADPGLGAQWSCAETKCRKPMNLKQVSKGKSRTVGTLAGVPLLAESPS